MTKATFRRKILSGLILPDDDHGGMHGSRQAGLTLEE